MPKARKVYTPGSQPPNKKKKGRPVKNNVVVRIGTQRKGNYRTKYTAEDFQRAFDACKTQGISVRAASREFNVSNLNLNPRLN